VATWDPATYLTFAEERGRPFADLVGRIAASDPATVVDLGCGPGQLTASFRQRWPSAHVLGLDSSPEMIERAQ
jgi:trans-aconitate 2-methyltransferase